MYHLLRFRLKLLLSFLTESFELSLVCVSVSLVFLILLVAWPGETWPSALADSALRFPVFS